MRRNILALLFWGARLMCLAQTGIYAINDCPDTTRACVSEYTSHDGTYSCGLVANHYYDSFGRQEEIVNTRLAPDGCDIAALTEHDLFGRLSRQWLFTKVPNSSGQRVAPDSLKTWTRASYFDEMPFSLTKYEDSPLSRQVSETGAGAAWHSAEKAARRQYLANSLTADSLVCMKISAIQTSVFGMAVSCTGTYPEGALSVSRSEDEDGHAIFEFCDRQGHIVLRRCRDVGGETGFCDTYFIYNGLGQLMCVLPPMAAPTNVGQIGADEIHEYAYLYTYDNRKRMVGKKLPGTDWIRYVYDIDGRLVFIQDGNLRQKSRWAFRLEDAFGREAVTGTCGANIPDISNTRVYTTAGAQQPIGYELPAYMQGRKIHVVNHYDNYGFLGLLPSVTADSIAYTTAAEFTEMASCSVGLLTGRMVYSLDSSDSYEAHAFYYDSRKRLIQSHSTNHLGGYEHDFYKLSFIGNEIKHKHVHTSQTGPTLEEIYDRTYDHAGRLLTTTHRLNGGTPVILSSNEYDDVGRLKSSVSAACDNLKMNYTYNVRSWTKTQMSPLFSETLHYEDGAEPCWGGNISSMVWNADTVVRRYDFTYDGLSRLECAEYVEAENQNAGRFSASYSYDKQGNTTGIRRYGYTSSLPTLTGVPVYYYGELDNLAFTYNGNKLQNVSDSCPSGLHANFLDGFNSAEEYAYDANGNLSRDLNKGITTIAYNSLNLPDSILSATGSTIRYTYGADGGKRRVKYVTTDMEILVPSSYVTTAQAEGLPGIVTPIPRPVTTTTMDYCSSAVYENGVLSMLLVEGGYVSFARTGTGANSTYTPTYHFYLKDHLGSNRVVASAEGEAEQVVHYYPYGSTFYEESALGNRYKFCGKELDKMHALDWYDSGARHYDHVLGRFHQIDPMAEKYYDWSPYAYCKGNPVGHIDLYGLFPKGIIKKHNEESYVVRCPTNTGLTMTTETQLTYFTFTKSASHLLSLVSGVPEKYIMNVRLEEFGMQMENNCITLGNSPDKTRMLVSPSYFDDSKMKSEQYYDWWFREFSHEVGHIKQIENDKSLGKYLLNTVYGYVSSMSHDDAPREKEAEQGSIVYRDFRYFVRSAFKTDLATLFTGNESEDYKIILLDKWWNAYKKQLK